MATGLDRWTITPGEGNNMAYRTEQAKHTHVTHTSNMQTAGRWPIIPASLPRSVTHCERKMQAL